MTTRLARRALTAVLLPALCVAAALAVTAGAPTDAAPPAPPVPSGDVMQRWLDRVDESYEWSIQQTYELMGVECVELRLHSQTWQDIVWKHRLVVAWPETVEDPAQAVLAIWGGNWNDNMERGDNMQPPAEAALVAQAALQSRRPTAVLFQVPFQPLFEGRTEDALIAHTFEKFIQTGDETWPLLLPMTKSAVRAMDAVQEWALQERDAEIRHFAVTGASKRGWTTWLAGAMDDRVNALAPMVIDVLNMGPQMEHQLAAWGDYSPMLDDYVRLDLPQRVDTPEGRRLMGIVDPWTYRDRLDKPKMIIQGTNDDYWPVDALNLYWDGLPGEKHIMYLPNQGHAFTDILGVTANLAALADRAAGDADFPDMEWTIAESDDGLRIVLESDVRPRRVTAWTATSATRDFRRARWSSEPFPWEPEGNRWAWRTTRDDDQWTCAYLEATYDVGGRPLRLCTQLHVLEPTD